MIDPLQMENAGDALRKAELLLQAQPDSAGQRGGERMAPIGLRAACLGQVPEREAGETGLRGRSVLEQRLICPPRTEEAGQRGVAGSRQDLRGLPRPALCPAQGVHPYGEREQCRGQRQRDEDQPEQDGGPLRGIRRGRRRLRRQRYRGRRRGLRRFNGFGLRRFVRQGLRGRRLLRRRRRLSMASGRADGSRGPGPSSSGSSAP